MSDARVTVDVVDTGRALIAGPGFDGYVVREHGPRSATGRPTYVVRLVDDTAEHRTSDRAPMACVTRSLRTSFATAAADMARRLAKHYGITDPLIITDDET